MFRFEKYSLKIGKKTLITNLDIDFQQGIISHLFGSNGVGKSCFAKSCLDIIKHTGKIQTASKPVVLGSYSNIPTDFRLIDVLNFMKKKYECQYVKELYELLELNIIPSSLKIKHMSDGQKQKVKLFAFLSKRPKVIILDEFTNALDRKSTLDIYRFLLKYVKQENAVCINITHNLADIEYMPGSYYLLANKTISQISDKEKIIEMYVKGGMI